MHHSSYKIQLAFQHQEFVNIVLYILGWVYYSSLIKWKLEKK
jgi:hypothetical protein